MTISGSGKGTLDSLGGLSLMDSSGSSFDSGYDAGNGTETSSVASSGGTSWEVSGQQLKQAREAGMKKRRSPSPGIGKGTGLGVSAETMRYYEQSLQPRAPSPAMQWQQQQQRQQQQYLNPPPQSTNPPLPYPTTPNPQSQSQLYLTEYQQPRQPSPRLQQPPYPQTPAKEAAKQRTSSREGKTDTPQLVPSPLRVPWTSPREWNSNPNSRMAQQQTESCLFSSSEKLPPPPAPGNVNGQGQGDSPVGATLKGPFILAELP
jgi:hypothetical protein